MDSNIALVTGGTSGIGRMTAELLAGAGYTVWILGRDSQRVQETVSALRQIHPAHEHRGFQADLSALRQVRQVIRDIQDTGMGIRILINNAASVFASFSLSEDGYEKTFATNHLGPFALTTGIMGRMKNIPGARIIQVTSENHSWGQFDPERIRSGQGYHLLKAYGDSKLADILFTTALAQQFPTTGIASFSMHPGRVRTEIGAKSGSFLFKIGWKVLLRLRSRPVEDAAQNLFHLATMPDVESYNGAYFNGSKQGKASALSQDPALAQALWDFSALALDKQGNR